jgi:hypothetical protein
MKLIKSIKKLSPVLLFLFASVLFAGSVFAVTSAKPQVSGFKVSTSSLNYQGGSIALSATVKNATRCIFTTTPAVAGVYSNRACSEGKVAYTAKLPENTKSSNIVYTFRLIVTGKKGEGSITSSLKTVTITPAVQPVINSFTSTNTGDLPSSGGNITLNGSVTNAVGCTITSNPAIEGTSSNPVTCSNGPFESVPIAMPANNSPTDTTDITYTFTLTVKGAADSISKTLQVTVDSNPPATATTTTIPPSTTSGNTVGVPAEPDALLQAGNDIWVASCSGNAVTEINNTTKKIVQELNNPEYQFNCPDAIAFDGTNIWVANKLGNSITELNASSGSLGNVIISSLITGPISMVMVTGGNIWVGDSYTGTVKGNPPSLIEINTSTGKITNQIIATDKDPVALPQSIVFDGTNIWVLSQQSIYEFRASNGAYVRYLNNGSVNGPSAISYYGGYIWVSGFMGNIVGEFRDSSGALVRTFKIASPGGPGPLIFNGSDLFLVTQYPTDYLREYTPSGVLIRNIAKSNKASDLGISTILLDGNSIWTANYTANSVTKYSL